MKKLILFIAAITLSIVATKAQDAQQIFDNYYQKTGIADFNENNDGRSSLLEMELSVMGMSMPFKVTSKYPNLFRIEMSVQGITVTTILRDSVAYVSAQGQTQTITDEAQIKQYAPVSNLISDMIPTPGNYEDLKYVGKEGKGKNECYVVECISKKEQAKTKLYFNIETGLLDKAYTETEVNGKTIKADMVFKKYTKFDDGALLMPTTISAKAEGQTVDFIIKSFETDVPVASWMFAAPKQ